MKRDMELMRKILIKLEEEFEAGEGNKFGIKIDGYDNELVGEHCELISEAGLVRGFKPNRGGMDNRLISYTIGPLNNRGHDYIEMIKNDDVWQQTNREIEEKKLPKTIETIGTIAGSIVGAFMREYNR